MVVSFFGWSDSVKRNPVPISPPYTRSGIPTSCKRSFPLDIILSLIIAHNSQWVVRVPLAASLLMIMKRAASSFVRVSFRQHVCYRCTDDGFAVAACAHCCMEKDEVDNLQLFLLWWLLLFAGWIV